MADPLTILAPAKLNLALAVGLPPASGSMHPICSWMVTINLFDELTITQLEAGRFSRYAILWHEEAKRRSDINWSVSKDLAVRAHHALEKHVGRVLPIQLKLEKRIPIGGGLGGGSSDAAAMLRGLNQLFDLGLPVDDLADIGATVGSDVPFLVHGGSALIEGFGEKIERHDRLPNINVVIVFPEASCPTASVYGLFDNTAPADHLLRAADVRALLDSGQVSSDVLFNDLADAAVRAAPSLADDMARLERLAERRVHVSGSGSSLFVLCDDLVHAEHLATAVETQLGLPAMPVQTQA